MTNPRADLRRVRINRMKRMGRCDCCGKPVHIYFAVERCSMCLGEVTDAFEDTRKNKPLLVRYYQYKVGMNP